jgi:hypothetical protein
VYLYGAEGRGNYAQVNIIFDGNDGLGRVSGWRYFIR